MQMFDEFITIEPAWLSPDGEDRETDSIAVMSGVCVRRDLRGFPFPARCSKSQLYDTAALLLDTIGRSEEWGECDFRLIDSLDDFSRGVLIETGLITRQFAEGGAGRFLMLDMDGDAACVINGEDHLKIDVRLPGLALEDALASASAFADDERLDTAADPVLGHLTSDPSNVGSGTKACVMLHLPALDASGDMGRTMASFERDWKRVTLEKVTNEGKNPIGSFYTVTNRITLSVSPEEITAFVEDAAKSLLAKELFARHRLTHMKNSDMSDKFWRAWGLLRYARKLAYMEAVNRVSFVKLGCDLGILPRADEGEWRRLLTGIQSAHLSLLAGRELSREEEPYERAAQIRGFIEHTAARSVIHTDIC